MSKSIALGLVGAGGILLAILLTGCTDAPSPTPSARAVPTPTMAPTHTATPIPTPTPTMAPTNTPTPEPTPATATLPLGVYLTLCASNLELADDLTFGDLSSELAAEADRFEALTPPAQLSEWHLLNIEAYRTAQAGVDTQPKDDVVEIDNPTMNAVSDDFVEKLREAAARVPRDVLQQMIEAHCINPDFVPDDDEEVPDDHGNDIDDATAIRVGADVRGALDYDGDVDFFRFQAEQGQSYQIDVALGTLHDSTVDLYDSDGWLMDSNDDYGDTLASRLYWNAPSSGERYIAVEGYGIGTYTLTVSLSDVIDDHGNWEVSATAIRVGTEVRGALDYDGDIDFFRFQAEAGRGYQIDVALGTLDDSIVELYDGDGAFVDTNDDYGDTLASRLYWNAPSSGERYVAVAGYGIGTYTLMVSLVDDHGNDFESATRIAIGEAVAVELEDLDDREVFAFRARPGTEYVLTLDWEYYEFRENYTESPLLAVYSANGQEQTRLMGYDLHESGVPSIGLVWRVVAGGDYYIVIGDGNTKGAGAFYVTREGATEPTATPSTVPTQAPEPTPAATPLSLDEYLTLCVTTELELADDATFGDLSSELAAEADRFEALTPPAQLSEWHLLNIEGFRTIQAFVELQPKDDVIDFIRFFLMAAVSADSEEKLSEAASRLPEDVLQQMIEAGCIDPEDLPDNYEALPDDHGNDIGDATAIRVGADVLGALDYDDDIDFFRFQAELGQSYQIDVALGTLDDSIVDLYDVDWSFLDSNDDYETFASRLFWEAPSSGERYVAVYGYGTGTYTLTVSIVDEHGDTAEDGVGVASDRAALVALYNATEGGSWTTRTNWLSGRPLDEWHGVTTNSGGRVTALNLSSNSLYGALPAALGDLTNLERLWLARNQLTGEIPPELGGLSNLDWLVLNENGLTGEIPPELGGLSNLAGLYLSNNQLTGCIPEGLRDIATNDLGQPNLPDCGLEGRPAASSSVSVSAGYDHTCGVRSDGSVACWGSNEDGEATPPAGSFDSVSAGGAHTCGLRSDGSVACWGWDGYGQATPPAGSFDSVSAGGSHTCGVRSNGSAACWGYNEYGQATPPAGSFDSVSAGGGHTCGLRSDGSVACWGNNWIGEATPAAGSFDSVSAGGDHTCGVRSDGSVACWGYNGSRAATPPAGSFVSVSAGWEHTCGVRSDGSVACWGLNSDGQATPPAGSFNSVSAGRYHTCGVRSDGSVACWGSDEYGEATPPGVPSSP